MLRKMPGSRPAQQWRQSHPMRATEAFSAWGRLGAGSDAAVPPRGSAGARMLTRVAELDGPRRSPGSTGSRLARGPGGAVAVGLAPRPARRSRSQDSGGGETTRGHGRPLDQVMILGARRHRHPRISNGRWQRPSRRGSPHEAAAEPHEPEPLGPRTQSHLPPWSGHGARCCIQLQASAQSTCRKISVVDDTCAPALRATRSRCQRQSSRVRGARDAW